MRTQLYIDGQWREGAAQERFDVLNPATEEPLASVASAEIAENGKARADQGMFEFTETPYISTNW